MEQQLKVIFLFGTEHGDGKLRGLYLRYSFTATHTILLKLRRTEAKTSNRLVERERGVHLSFFGAAMYIWIFRHEPVFHKRYYRDGVQGASQDDCSPVGSLVLLDILIVKNFYMKTIVDRNPLLAKKVLTLEIHRYSLCMTITLIKFQLFNLPGAHRHIHGGHHEHESPRCRFLRFTANRWRGRTR